MMKQIFSGKLLSVFYVSNFFIPASFGLSPGPSGGVVGGGGGGGGEEEGLVEGRKEDGLGGLRRMA